MTTQAAIFAALIVFALGGIAAGVWRIALKLPVQIMPAELPQPLPAQIKIVMPRDIEAVAASTRKVAIQHRQPDGNWHHIGETDIENHHRIDLELAADGRRIVWPDGTVQESK